MSKFVLDLFFASTFAVLLLILLRTRNKLFTENRSSFNYSVTGLLALFFVSIIQLSANQRLFGAVPFLSEPMYAEMVQIIGIISGITLLVAGASMWIPSRKKNKSADVEPNTAADIAWRIKLEVVRSKQPDFIFDELPVSIMQAFGFDGFAVLKYSSRSRKVYLANHSGIRPEYYDQIMKSIKSRKDQAEIFGCVCRLGHPAAEVPVRVQVRQAAGIYFWKTSIDKASESDQIALNRISEMVSSHFGAHFQKIKSEYYETSWRHYFQAVDILRGKGSLKGRMQLLSQLFHQAVGSEYFSLAVMLNGRENIRQYTCGLNGNTLLDGHSNPIRQSAYFGQVIDSGAGIIVHDATKSELVSNESLIVECGQNSLIAIPLFSMGRTLGILTLGHKRAGYFNHRRLLRAEMLASALTPAVEKELGQAAVEGRERYLSALLTFDRDSENIQNVDQLLNRAAEIIEKSLSTTMVRIVTLGSDNISLSTKALHTVRPFDRGEVDSVNLSSKTTFWHHLAAHEQRPMLINQEDAETRMNKNEAGALVFDTVRSALIVPITINGLTFGLITLGEERNWQRYSYDAAAINFVREMAARLGMAVKLLKFSQALITDRGVGRIAESTEGRKHLINRLKSPASTIRGSLDLLKRGEGLDADRSGRLMSMMDESTERIMALLNEGE